MSGSARKRSKRKNVDSSTASGVNVKSFEHDGLTNEEKNASEAYRLALSKTGARKLQRAVKERKTKKQDQEDNRGSRNEIDPDADLNSKQTDDREKTGAKRNVVTEVVEPGHEMQIKNAVDESKEDKKNLIDGKERTPIVNDFKQPGVVGNVHVTVVLEQANLETLKLSGSKDGYALLNSDDHGSQLRKSKRDANDARPDITHQCVLALLDSPLNKSGHLTVYIRTKKNVLIAVHPQTRIPRTFKRFSGLMVELLEKFKVRGTSGSQPLLQVIRNPVTSHLPVGQRRILCTYNCDNIVDIRHHAMATVEKQLREVQQSKRRRIDSLEQSIAKQEDRVDVLYVIGAMAHGKVEVDYADEEICISEYPLSAATVCSRVSYAYECLLGIL